MCCGFDEIRPKGFAGKRRAVSPVKVKLWLSFCVPPGVPSQVRGEKGGHSSPWLEILSSLGLNSSQPSLWRRSARETNPELFAGFPCPRAGFSLAKPPIPAAFDRGGGQPRCRRDVTLALPKIQSRDIPFILLGSFHFGTCPSQVVQLRQTQGTGQA